MYPTAEAASARKQRFERDDVLLAIMIGNTLTTMKLMIQLQNVANAVPFARILHTLSSAGHDKVSDLGYSLQRKDFRRVAPNCSLEARGESTKITKYHDNGSDGTRVCIWRTDLDLMRETTHHRKDTSHHRHAANKQRTATPAVDEEPRNEGSDEEESEEDAAHQICSFHVKADGGVEDWNLNTLDLSSSDRSPWTCDMTRSS